MRERKRDVRRGCEMENSQSEDGMGWRKEDEVRKEGRSKKGGERESEEEERVRAVAGNLKALCPSLAYFGGRIWMGAVIGWG